MTFFQATTSDEARVLARMTRMQTEIDVARGMRKYLLVHRIEMELSGAINDTIVARTLAEIARATQAATLAP